MFKFILKIFAWAVALVGVLAALAYWDKANTPEYIEIYSDEDEQF